VGRSTSKADRLGNAFYFAVEKAPVVNYTLKGKEGFEEYIPSESAQFYWDRIGNEVNRLRIGGKEEDDDEEGIPGFSTPLTDAEKSRMRYGHS
jgi:hypothetical protein